MEYSEYQEQAAEYMRLALPLMKKHGIAMTPANYAVWYEYVAGNNEALRFAVDASVENNERLTEKQSSDLYQKFFDREKDQAALLEMRQDLRRVLAEVLTFVSSGVISSQKTSDNLTNILDKFHSKMKQEEVRGVIDEVLSETRLAVSTSDLLSERLNTTMAEMHDLKKELDSAKREAKIDTLTKLANRKALDEVLAKATRDADNNNVELCIIFSDLDLFKEINDKHGHLVGDQVLRVVANTLKGAVKGRDLVARYGGEEFAIVLLNTSIENVKGLAENIRAEIAAKRMQRKDTRESLGTITMSFGVARYFPSEGIDSFMQRADRALYMAKRNGRNAVAEALPPTI
ncbi:MAG: GGDEF domain-containing protein [Methylophaga sp.]|nr:MAG: GGDEF domain-containing protein [Methylophaga sp.]